MMPNLTDFEAAITRAEELLAQRAAITDAIAAAEGELPATLQSRLDAESNLASVESASALGETDSNAAGAARKHLTAAREALDGLSARLRGLKARAQTQSDDLIRAQAAVQSFMPTHRQDAACSFEPEWTEAVSAFSCVLAKRVLLEGALKTRFDLPEPSASLSTEKVDVGDLADLTKPGRLLAALERSINEANGMKQAAARAVRRKAPLDMDGVYRMRKPWQGFKTGDLVTAEVIGAEAEWLFQNGFLLGPVTF